MDYVIYYSNYCKHSPEVLKTLINITSLKIKFICIDCRYQKEGHWYTVLETGHHVILPNNLSQTPFLLILCDNYKTIMGSEPILQYFKHKKMEQTRVSTNNYLEPMSYSFNGGMNTNVVSDSFSFIEENYKELESVGNGGSRQMYSYMPANANESMYKIHTPEEERFDKNVKKEQPTIEHIQNQRNMDIQAYH
jgi:hypothetical protein